MTTGGVGPLGAQHMPIDQAMAELVDRHLLPIRKGALPLPVEPAWDRPKDSNGGTGRIVETPKPIAPKKGPDKKQPVGKGDQPKKK